MRISDWSSDVCSSDLESPNLAARLQGLAAPDSVVIDATTHSLAGSAFDCEDLGAQTMKGVMRPVAAWRVLRPRDRSEEHTSELQSLMRHLVCRLLLEKKKKKRTGRTEQHTARR